MQNNGKKGQKLNAPPPIKTGLRIKNKIMNTIIILNFIINIAILSFFAYKYNPFWISITRTFWMKKVTSFTIMYRYYKSEYSSSSRGIITFPIRNYKKWSEWDSKQFNKGRVSNA